MSEELQFDLRSGHKVRESKRHESGLHRDRVRYNCPECDHYTRELQDTGNVMLRCPHCYVARKLVPRSEWVRSLSEQQVYHNQALEEMLQQRLHRKKSALWSA